MGTTGTGMELQVLRKPAYRPVGLMEVYTPETMFADQDPVTLAAEKAVIGAHFLDLPPDYFGGGPGFKPELWGGMIKDPLTGEGYNPKKRYLIVDLNSGETVGQLGLTQDFDRLVPGIKYGVAVPYDEIDGNGEEKGEA